MKLRIHGELLKKGFESLFSTEASPYPYARLNYSVQIYNHTSVPTSFPADEGTLLVEWDNLSYTVEMNGEEPIVILNTDYELALSPGTMTYLRMTSLGSSTEAVASIGTSGADINISDTSVVTDNYYALRNIRLTLADNDFDTV